MADMEGRGREDKKSQNCSLSILTIAEQALINNLGRRFQIATFHEETHA